MERSGISPDDVDGIVWGGVLLPAMAPNVGREIALDLGLPYEVEARTVTRACASGLQAVTDAVAAIERGDCDVMIAGGSDSTSSATIPMPERLVKALAPLALGKPTPGALMQALGRMSPLRECLPRRPQIAERTTGQVMGQAADEMATRNGVTREEQDAFAVQSHHRAAAAIDSGRFAMEVSPVHPPDAEVIDRDGFVRGDTSVEKVARLSPVFDAEGTVTAANSSPLTDGASAVLLMTQERAEAMGLTPLARFRSWAYAGVDPADQLLMGPALAMPKALERAGMTLEDVDLVDMHEAFAAQVLSVLKMLASDGFARERLGRHKAVGEVDMTRLNVHGGSIALGHPFAATGARMVTTMANELHLSGKETALLGICAAGGLGAAAVMERV